MTSTLPPIAQAFSGAIGSASANALIYPLDLVVTRVQLDPPNNPKSLRGAVQILQHLIKKYGLSSLYDGLWSDTCATLLSNFFYFYIYSFLRSLSTRRLLPLRSSPKVKGIPLHKPGMLEELALGFLAGVASRAISTPLNIVTLRLQTERADEDVEAGISGSESMGIVSTIKLIYKERGLAGFWRGFKTTTLLSLNPSITLAFFQLFRRTLSLAHSPRWSSDSKNKSIGVDPSPREAFVGGALSNSLAISLLYPLILAKTRLQSSSANSLTEVLKDAYVGRDTLFQSRHKNNKDQKLDGAGGLPGLYQGLEVQILKGFLSQGVTFLVKGRIEQLIVSAYLRRQRVSLQN